MNVIRRVSCSCREAVSRLIFLHIYSCNQIVAAAWQPAGGIGGGVLSIPAILNGNARGAAAASSEKRTAFA